MSRDGVPLPGSKEQRNLNLTGEGFWQVFRYGELGYEWIGAGGCVRGCNVTGSHFRGQKNIRIWILSETVSMRIFGVGNTNMSEAELVDVWEGVMWQGTTSRVKRTSESDFHQGTVLTGFSIWGTRIWLNRSWWLHERGSCDLVALPGSKKHWNLIFAGSSFYMIFRYGELEYEWIWAGGCINKGSVTGSHFRGQKNIQIWCLREGVSMRFFSYGELKNESDSVVDALKGAHVAESDCRGQKTLKSNFCRETLLTDLSVSGPRRCG